MGKTFKHYIQQSTHLLTISQFCVHQQTSLKKLIRSSTIWSYSSRRGAVCLHFASPRALGPNVVSGLSSIEQFLQCAVPCIKKTWLFFLPLPCTLDTLHARVGVWDFILAVAQPRQNCFIWAAFMDCYYEPCVYGRRLQDLLSCCLQKTHFGYGYIFIMQYSVCYSHKDIYYTQF